MGEALKAGATPSPPQAPHSLSSTAAPAADGLDSATQDHKASVSDSGDGSCIPLLQTESIQLGDLDSALLTEVKDVLISHERVVTHSDRIIGKGVGAKSGGDRAEMEFWDDKDSRDIWAGLCSGLSTNLCDLGNTTEPF